MFPPFWSKFIQIHAVVGGNWLNNSFSLPPLELAPPPLGNLGSAADQGQLLSIIHQGGSSIDAKSDVMQSERVCTIMVSSLGFVQSINFLTVSSQNVASPLGKLK